MMRWLIQPVLVLWAAPNSLLGLCIGCIGLLTGGRARVRAGCIEFHGGLVRRWLEGLSVVAMTLGHTILGQSASELDLVRTHELVHVRQYERWGPLFLPAYLGASAWLWWQGKDYYRLNPFEVEAFAIDDPWRRQTNRVDVGNDEPS